MTDTTRSDADEGTSAPASGRPPAALAAPTGLLRWVPVVGVGLMLVLLVRGAGSGISDPDTLWHVLAGTWLRHDWTFVGADPHVLSTREPWVLNQWLPELVASVAHQWGGLRAVAWLSSAAIVVLTLAVYVGCRRNAGPLAAALACGVAVAASAASLSPRPQLVGFVLLAVCATAWLSTVGDGRARWWLIPLSWLWACCHGTWVIGVLLGAVVVAGLALDRAVSRRDAARLALVPMGAAVAGLCTPVGPLGMLTSFRSVHAVSAYIQEWRPSSLSDPSTIAALGLGAVALAAAVRQRRVSWALLGIVAFGVVWAVMQARTVAAGAIVLAPLAAGGLDRALRRPRPTLGRERWVLGSAAAIALVVAAVLAAQGPDAPVHVPTRLTPALKALPAGTVVWNQDALGAWLMWSEPQLEHTSDTRAELFGPVGARSQLRILRAGPGWEADLEAAHPGAVLVSARSPLVSALRDRGWALVGVDAGYALLRR